jgi:regulator of RNase E activity RraA
MALQRSTWDSVSHFLVPELNTGAGKVYVAASEDGLVTEFALAGGFSCAYFERLGFDGIVLGGAVRDAHALAELSIPIWASNFIPADTQGNYQVKENGTWCRIGSVTIKTGDWIFSDSSGAVCIPVSIFDAVIARAIELEEVEMVIKTRVGQGERLFDVVRSLGRL